MANSFKAHPWHGVFIGANAPKILTTFIEIVPSDTVKYEIDKDSGYLKIDRPQKFSNIVPALYGFVPQTYCGDKVGEFAAEKTGRAHIAGDGDPLDVLVLTEKNIVHGNILIQAKPIGGFRMIDKGEADDKIIAVMVQDEIYQNYNDISELPEAIVKRLKHYFLTYKNIPGEATVLCEITHTYGREEAYEVINRSQIDYQDKFSL
ncbi:MAG: inorganic pyrophosphatase [Chitinophagales bacterium]|nr:inorganic pyrophosphatase [Chitinophagales bacterium]